MWIHRGKHIDCCRCTKTILLVLIAILLDSCVSMPPPPTPEIRKQLGHVGVVAVASTPRVEFHTFAKGWAAGAVKGGSLGLMTGLIDALGESLRNPPSGPYAAPAILITTGIIITVNTLGYGVAGGMEAVPKNTAQQIDQDLVKAIGDAKLANDLAHRIYTTSSQRKDLASYAMTYLDTATITQNELVKRNIDTTVEVQVTEAGFRGGSGAHPKVRFYLNAHIRLLNAKTGVELYTRDFQYLSHERPFAEWFANSSKELSAGFQQAMVMLADQIVDELFHVTRFPFESGLWALPGTPEFGCCWFRPLYPAVQYTSLWHQMRTNSPGIDIIYTSVDTRQPALKWETFPRPRDQKPANAEVIRQIGNVTYDLKVWETSNGAPERLVYEVNGLNAPEYQLPNPLKAKTKYFWSFRARYTLSGQAQVTRWAFSSVPSNTPSDYPQRQPGGTCDLDATPNNNYYRFQTP